MFGGSCRRSDKITVVLPAPRKPINTVIDEKEFDMTDRWWWVDGSGTQEWKCSVRQ